MMSGEGKMTFRDYLEKNPEVRASLQQRMEDHPEYRDWLQKFGKGVLAGLDSQRSQRNGLR